jgi:hypothetical protein
MSCVHRLFAADAPLTPSSANSAHHPLSVQLPKNVQPAMRRLRISHAMHGTAAHWPNALSAGGFGWTQDEPGADQRVGAARGAQDDIPHHEQPMEPPVRVMAPLRFRAAPVAPLTSVYTAHTTRRSYASHVQRGLPDVPLCASVSLCPGRYAHGYAPWDPGYRNLPLEKSSTLIMSRVAVTVYNTMFEFWHNRRPDITLLLLSCVVPPPPGPAPAAFLPRLASRPAWGCVHMKRMRGASEGSH